MKKTTCLQSYADVYAIEFNQKVVPRVTYSTTKSDFATQIYNHWRRNHCNDMNNILSRPNVVQLSKASGSCTQKAKILAVTAKFRTNNVSLSVYHDMRTLPTLLTVIPNGVPQACTCTNYYCERSILIENTNRVDKWLTDVTQLP